MFHEKIYTHILNVSRYHRSKSRHPCRSFSRAQPRCSRDHRGQERKVHEPQDRSACCVLPRARVLPRVQSHRQSYGSRAHQDRSHRDNCALLGSQSRSPSHSPPRVGWCLPFGSNQPPSCRDTRGRVRGCVRGFASPISSVLLSKKMKYLILGPASMGLFSLIGALKLRETQLADVKEISGSSAGAILALFLAVGMSVDEILDVSLSLNIPNFVKIRIGSFFNKFGFVDMGPIRKKLVEICGSDPSFRDLDMKIYIAAFCLNSSETVYFSQDTHPDMKVIDAVCMSMAVPFIFACGTHDGKTYIDGGTKEDFPLTPFLDKKPHEVTCIKIIMDKMYQETIDTPKQFVDTLVRSALTNRETYTTPIEIIEINVKSANIFDFNMDYEEKLKLYTIGYST
jgi:predicted acylesterase/phospholipase RssA